MPGGAASPDGGAPIMDMGGIPGGPPGGMPGIDDNEGMDTDLGGGAIKAARGSYPASSGDVGFGAGAGAGAPIMGIIGGGAAAASLAGLFSYYNHMK